MPAAINTHVIQQKIFFIRGHKVIVDRDLAELYGVSTKRLNEQVKRNLKRFPPDFMFRLTKKESLELVANCDRFRSMKHSNVTSHVFTEQGVAMLSTVLNSERAIQVNIAIMRTFVRLKEFLSTHKALAEKLNKLEERMDEKDKEVRLIFEAIKQLLEDPVKPKRKIGFHA